MNVGLFIGGLCEAPVDVVWTSTSSQLSSIRGADAVLHQRGGQELRAACQSTLDLEHERSGQRGFPAGSAIATVAGPLPFQAIVHCVAFDAQGTSPETITACVRNAWDTTLALKPRPRRIATPVLAADNGKYDLLAALRLIADTLAALPPGLLEQLLIVLPDQRHEPAARTILEQRFGRRFAPLPV